MSMPDPDKIFKALERVKEIMKEAGETPSSAQRDFQKLAAAYDKLSEKMMSIDPSTKPNPARLLMDIGPSFLTVQFTMQSIKAKAEKDPAVGAILTKMSQDMIEELKPIIDQLGGALPGGFNFPGMGDLGDFGRKADDDLFPPLPPKKDTPPKGNPGKPPKGGDFDL